MKQLREFLNRQIEVFLNYEFGPGMQNITPSGIRPIRWEPEHTARLVHHLAGNWEMVEEALRHKAAAESTVHHAGCAYCPTRFDCTCDSPGQRHMCPRCDDAAEDSKMSGEFPHANPGEVAVDNAQADAAAAEYDAAPEGEKPPVNPGVPW
jgi:hypothetical protein